MRHSSKSENPRQLILSSKFRVRFEITAGNLKDLLISTHEKIDENQSAEDPDTPNKKSMPALADVGTIEGDIGFSSPFLKDDTETQKKPVTEQLTPDDRKNAGPSSL